MSFERYWYVLCESTELKTGAVLPRRVLGRDLVVFRGEGGEAAVMEDRCLHRCGKLSKGQVDDDGQLVCPYHGWRYRHDGTVAHIPASLSESTGALKGKAYPIREQDGLVYVCVTADEKTPEPVRIPHFGERGWGHFRTQNRFRNSVANCVENFIDVPHTAFVHDKTFRSYKAQRIGAHVSRDGDRVSVYYSGERRNLGSFSWFLNPRGLPVEHEDHFMAPNVTHVRYAIGNYEYLITSQSVPVDEFETLVFTDIRWRFGIWTRLAYPFVKRQAERVIAQDIEVLNDQGEVLRKNPAPFLEAAGDAIHQLVDEIRDAIAAGRDPDMLPPRERKLEFLI